MSWAGSSDPSSEPASTRRTRFSMPRPTKVATMSSRRGAMPSSMRMALAAMARSGAVSSRVPSRSNKAALSTNGLSAEDFATQFLDDCSVVGLAENGRAGHEGIGAGGTDLGNVVDLHAAVDFKQNVVAAGQLPVIDAGTRLAQL